MIINCTIKLDDLWTDEGQTIERYVTNEIEKAIKKLVKSKLKGRQSRLEERATEIFNRAIEGKEKS